MPRRILRRAAIAAVTCLAVSAASLMATSANAEISSSGAIKPPVECFSANNGQFGNWGVPYGALVYNAQAVYNAERRLRDQGLPQQTPCSRPAGYENHFCGDVPSDCFYDAFMIGPTWYMGSMRWLPVPTGVEPTPTPEPTPEPTPTPEMIRCGDDNISSVDAAKIVTLAGWAGEEEAAEHLRDDICMIFRQEAVLVSSEVTSLPSEVAGPAARGGKAVTNRYELRLFKDNAVHIVVGVLSQVKVFYFADGEVTDAAGGDPDPASYMGRSTNIGDFLGWTYTGTVQDSFRNFYQSYDDKAKGSHVSDGQGQFTWSPPVASLVVGDKNVNHYMYIRAFSNGAVLCAGGHDCGSLPQR